MNIQKLYSKYQILEDKNPFSTISLFNNLPIFPKGFKVEIHALINESIVDKDKIKLRFALNLAYKDEIDTSYTEVISKLLTETWHDEHEELVNIIYLENLDDDIFTDALYRISIEPDLYRKFDDELESTLRKCIHALIMINSERSNAYVQELKDTENSNIDSVLSVYHR